jgi:tetratricopeptide (TPR) repeat protein
MSTGFIRRNSLLLTTCCLLGAVSPSGNAASLASLEKAFAQGNWDDVAQAAHEVLQSDANSTTAKFRGYEALKSRNYRLTALLFLRRTTPEQWAQPQPEHGTLDITWELYGAITPDEFLRGILPPSDTSEAYLWDQGRSAFRKRDFASAKANLARVTSESGRARANYLLGSIALIEKDSKRARSYFHDTCASDRADKGLLGCLAEARLLYAAHDDEAALQVYGQIPDGSPLAPLAEREKAWIQLRAGKVPAVSGIDDSIESLMLKASVALKRAQPDDARDLLNEAFKKLDRQKKELSAFAQSGGAAAIPNVLSQELTAHQEYLRNLSFLNQLKTEATNLAGEKNARFSVFSFAQKTIASWRDNAQKRQNTIALESANARVTWLDNLYIQGKLLAAECSLAKNEVPKATRIEQALKELDSTNRDVARAYPELELRRAELLWEQGRALEDQKRDTAILLKEKSKETAQALIKNFPSFRRIARALFFTGYAQLETGAADEGVRTLTRFIKEHPGEKALPDAYRILGDHWFALGKYEEADKNYRKVLSFDQSPAVGYAHYRLGWSAYYRGRFNDSMGELEKALQWTDQWDKTPEALALEKQAKRDLITIFAEDGDFKKAPAFFSKLLAGESSEWVVALGQQLESTGQNEKAAELYRNLIARQSTDPNNVLYQLRVTWAFYQIHDWENTRAAANELITRYRDILANATDPRTIECEKKLHEITTQTVGQLTAGNSSSDTNQAIQMTQTYLTAFREWPQSQDILFEQGRLLMKQKKWEEAATVLTENWNRFNAQLDATKRELSLRTLIDALREIEKPKKAAAQPSATALEIIALVDEYNRAFPTTRYIRDIAFLGSTLYFKYEQIDKGITASQHVFDFNPRDEFAKKAFENLRVAYYKKKDWEDCYRWATEMGSRKMPGMETFVDSLITIRGESLFLWAEGTAENRRAADLFLKIADDSDLQEFWGKALYNAFIRLRTLGDKSLAMKVALRLDTLAPNSDWVKNIAAARGAIALEIGDYAGAVAPLTFAFENPAKEAKADSQASVQLNLALSLEATGKKEDAIPLLQDYLQNDQRSTAGSAEAELALIRLGKRNRMPASLETRWQKLENKLADFEKQPIPVKGSPDDRVQAGAKRLETLSQESLAISNDPKSGKDRALEAFCAIPFLYRAYNASIDTLGSTLTGDAQDELAKVSASLDSKAKELGQQCLSKSIENEHDGAYFRRVNERWGWGFDPILTERIKALTASLQKKYPAFDAAPAKKDETALLEAHLEGRESADSWYALARLRCGENKNALCRLTINQALTKYPAHGPLLNANGILEERIPSGTKISDMFVRAAHTGSAHAYPNLALFHLTGGRLKPGLEALREAWEAKAFDDNDSIKKAVKEWIK